MGVELLCLTSTRGQSMWLRGWSSAVCSSDTELRCPSPATFTIPEGDHRLDITADVDLAEGGLRSRVQVDRIREGHTYRVEAAPRSEERRVGQGIRRRETAVRARQVTVAQASR